MESPFETTAKIIGERANGFDDLRIIARDNKALSAVEKERIEAAADELESSQRAHLMTYSQLLETQSKLIAVNERLIAVMRQSQPAPKRWSYSTGWLKAEFK